LSRKWSYDLKTLGEGEELTYFLNTKAGIGELARDGLQTFGGGNYFRRKKVSGVLKAGWEQETTFSSPLLREVGKCPFLVRPGKICLNKGPCQRTRGGGGGKNQARGDLNKEGMKRKRSKKNPAWVKEKVGGVTGKDVEKMDAGPRQ